MSDVKKAKDGAVSSIAGNDLVMICVNGKYHPISFDNLMAAVKGGIQIGGRNLVTGSANGQGWSIAPSDGVYAIKASTSSETFLYGPKLPIEVGKTYVVSFMAKATGNLSSCDIYLSSSYGGPNGSIYTIDSEWKRYYKVIPVNVSNTLTGKFRIDNNGSTDGQPSTLWVKDIKVEEGNVPTAWSPAPEDIASGSWGGVIGLLPITYNSEEKGGAHEWRDEACGQAESCADNHLSFGSLDALCEWIGQFNEVLPGYADSSDSILFGCRPSDARLESNSGFYSQSSGEWSWGLPVDNVFRQHCQNTGLLLLVPQFINIPSKTYLRKRRQFLGRLETNGLHVVAERKEVTA